MKKYQISSSQNYKLGIVKANSLREAMEKAYKMFPNRRKLRLGRL